ncbi:sushi, von Willebrand factor type A, EGF and pentraxin domain-containing protein 1-like [Anomaloglossus baeobatrachus]|uniref:sushi, von Willebrand factor type A, EGF and pentraxin domain-containing protein 1-like n=1 Tax=Anomaloglossus baeobatrachus TaxID=238106 RepID=UPI003F504DA5
MSGFTIFIVFFLASFPVRSHAPAALDAMDMDPDFTTHDPNQDFPAPCLGICQGTVQQTNTNGGDLFTGFCSYPPDIEYAELNTDGKSVFSTGMTVSYICHTGYSPSPGTSVTVTCLTNRTWSIPETICKYGSPPSKGQTKPITPDSPDSPLPGFCRSPPNIPFAELNEEFSKQTVFSKDATVTLTCQTGYLPTPGHILTATCLSDGTWSSGTICARICRSPPVIPYAELKDDLLKNMDFLQGAIVSYKCKPGFQFIPGTKDFVTCVDGQWSTNDFFCKPDFCGSPPRLDYGQPRDEYLDRTSFSFGTKIMYICRPGYRKIPGKTAIVTCTDDGTWSLPNAFCTRKSCGNPGEVENGQLHAENFDFGSKVTYTCDRGYKMISKRNYRDCQADGTWSNVLPECTVQNCPSPSEIRNGHYYPDKEEYSYLDSVKYVCRGNLALIGEHTVSCTEEGTWSSNAPQCKSVQCTDPQVNNAYKLSGYSGPYYFNSAVRFSCRSQYKLIGSDTVKCNDNNKWEPELPKCVGFCKFPPDFLNTELAEATNESSFIEGTKLKYKCKQGYEPVLGAPDTVTCIAFKWSPSLQFCTPITCVDPEPVPNGKIVRGSFTFGSRITYACEIGYRMKNVSFRDCLANQSWSLPIPECEVSTCPVPQWAKNGWIYPEKEQYVYNATVSFGCHEGYKLIGEDEITCSHDGRWNYRIPECKGICEDPPPLDYAIFDVKPSTIFVAGVTIQYTCRRGYIRNNVYTNSITCLESGKWSNITKEFCTRRSCGHPPRAANLVVEVESFLFESEAVYRCEKGYKMHSSDNTFKCESNGRWTGTLPVCKVQTCSPPEVLENGSYSLRKNEYLYGETVTYKCNRLQLVGKASVSCTDEGKWSSGAPQCRDACILPPELPFAVVNIEISSPEYADRGESIQYKCRPGFVSVNNLDTEITCLENLKWSRYSVFCTPISCGNPGEIANGQMQSEHFSFGSRVNYTCNPGYSMLSKRNYRECQADGTWSGKPPVCKEPICEQIWELQELHKEVQKCTSSPDEWIKYLQVQYLNVQIENLRLDNEVKKKQVYAATQTSSTSVKKTSSG